ncbi:hypothetical protein AAG570_006296 [Ranatra chinensis]|uniref:Uncharacterized protein n=1 Tax=Ranatra chinensis TaxID=642074 RepID=A0ABD0YTK2_9HEMI
MKRLYNMISDTQFSICKCKHKYKKLLYSLCFFHAILIERKKFQQLGWNVVYSFNDSDFEVSENLLSIYLDEYRDTPWDALKYLIAGICYGGHVTDDWDRRLLTTYINRLSALPTYFIPTDTEIENYREFINTLPAIDHPNAFGQHPNADTTSLMIDTRILCETLMSLQVTSSDASGESKEVKVMALADDVLNKVPEPINYELTERHIGPRKTPLDVVLLQEISRYNVLLIKMEKSLVDLKKGIQGFIVMSSELEEIFTCIYDGRVPSMWLKAYPSLKTLGSWTYDLVLRVQHFSKWATKLKPPLLFWLSAFTFPTGFLTAVLQVVNISTFNNRIH